MAGFNIGDIIVTIKAKTDDLKKGLDDIQGITDKATHGTNKLGSLAGGVAQFGKVAAVGMAAAGTAAAAFGVLSVKAFSEAENVMAQTEATLKSTGGVAGVTADQVTELAGSLQKVTKFSDETIQSGENLLLTFTNIGKDIFPQATEIMLDMSQALGQDVKSSAVQLGKALQDPILGVTALRRVGVNFTEDQQAVIQKLVETGKAGEAQALIMKELQTEFGGSAKAAGETFAGKLEILKNKFSDIQETVGKVIVEAITPAISAFAEFVSGIDWQQVIENTINAISTLWNDYLVPFAEAVKTAALALWEFFKPSLEALWKTIEEKVWPTLKKLWDAVEPGLTGAIKVLAIVLGALLMAAIWLIINGLNVFFTICSKVIDIISQLIKWIGNIVGVVINTVSAVINWFSKIPGTVSNIIDNIVSFFRGLPGKIGGVIGGVVDTVTSPFKSAFNAIAKFWNNSVGKLSFKAPDWVPGIGGKGFSMPQLPMLAEGTGNFGGGWAMVGERGREMVKLPSGSKVFSNEKTEGMMGSNVAIYGDVRIDSEQDADYFMKRLSRNSELELRGLSPVGGLAE